MPLNDQKGEVTEVSEVREMREGEGRGGGDGCEVKAAGRGRRGVEQSWGQRGFAGAEAGRGRDDGRDGSCCDAALVLRLQCG
jgi:hypothetical protein